MHFYSGPPMHLLSGVDIGTEERAKLSVVRVFETTGWVN
jgi:hypothetical protein